MKIYTFREIAEYIKVKYPECCLAYNDKNSDMDDESLIEQLDEFFSSELIGICGCGNNTIVMESIRDLLNIYYECKDTNDDSKYRKLLMERFKCEFISDNSLLLFMVYILDDKGLLEHGSSVNNCCLTTLGEMCRQVYNKCNWD